MTQPPYRRTTCAICRESLPHAATGRPRQTCSSRCRQLKRRRMDYRGWIDPRRWAKEDRRAEKQIRRWEKRFGDLNRFAVSPSDSTRPIPFRTHLRMYLARGIPIKTCAVCEHPYLPNGRAVCSDRCARQRPRLKRSRRPFTACAQCRTAIPNTPRRRFCSSTCRARHWREHRRTCPHCRKHFAPNPSRPHQRYCSEQCRVASSRKRRYRPTPITERNCRICRRRFFAKDPRRIYCSARCYGRKHKAREGMPYDYEPRPCQCCGELFQPHFRQGGRQIYCSRRCSNRVQMCRLRARQRAAASHDATNP